MEALHLHANFYRIVLAYGTINAFYFLNLKLAIYIIIKLLNSSFETQIFKKKAVKQTNCTSTKYTQRKLYNLRCLLGEASTKVPS